MNVGRSGTTRYYVYTLLSLRDRNFYTGFTTDLKDRLTRHVRGEVKSTANRRPLRLIHYEYFINEGDAKAREVFLKSGFGRDNLKQALKRTLSTWPANPSTHAKKISPGILKRGEIENKVIK